MDDKANNLEAGLCDYYASQADIMLAQYQNINRLLGKTNHHTHPGNFSEFLYRDFLRKFLHPSLGVDKGFFHGRTVIDEVDCHCPEIDILIHDRQNFQPLFRLDDFVIVRPEAVRGIIQVKKEFTSGEIRDGAYNVSSAKQHLFNVICDKYSRFPGGFPPMVFTGVIGIGDKNESHLDLFKTLLLEISQRFKKYNNAKMTTSIAVLPDFIGSLTGQFICNEARSAVSNPRYLVLKSYHTDQTSGKTTNISAQGLLSKIDHVLDDNRSNIHPPFSFPEMPLPYYFTVVHFVSVADEGNGVLSLRGNNGTTFRYRKPSEPLSEPPPFMPHVTIPDSQEPILDDIMRAMVSVPDKLAVKSGSTNEWYQIIK